MLFSRYRLTVVIFLFVALSWCLVPALQTDAAEDFGSLLAKIEAANNSGGSHTVTLTEDITLSAALPPITGEITIEGRGRSISGDSQFRIFDINGGTLVINDLTMTEGKAEENGGAIRMWNGARVTIERSTFSDNVARDGGAVAMSSSGDRLTVSNSSFSGNIAEKSAGAILADRGTVSITGSNFTKNCAEIATNIVDKAIGGNSLNRVIETDGCTQITFFWTRHEDVINLEGAGGAISLLNGARVAIDSSIFTENKATRGGAIATASHNIRLTVNNSSFQENRVSVSAGAIFADGGTSNIMKSSFLKNSAEAGGGAIGAVNNSLDISNSTFSENQTQDGAGALEFRGNAEVTITHATFMNNVSLNRTSDTIEKRGDGKLYLRNSIVASSGSAEDCVGGLDQKIGNLSLDGTCADRPNDDPLLGDLTGSPAFYPLLDRSPAVDAADPEFCLETDQIGTARPHGGGCDIGAIESRSASAAEPTPVPPVVCTLAFQIIAANSDAEAESCPAGKGADTISLERDIVLFSPLPSITSTITIEGNGHTISGDGKFRIFDVDGGRLTIRKLTMTEGSSQNEDGGAVRLQDGAHVTVNDSRFTNNKARNGGAIAVKSRNDKLKVSNSGFVGNRASYNGGAISVNVGTSSISSSSFFQNSARHDGGAIRIINHGKIDASNSSFIGNQANRGGAALAVENGAAATLTHVTVYNFGLIGSGTAIHIHSSFGSAGEVNFRNSIIAGSGALAHCYGRLTQNVGNLIEGGSCSPMFSEDPLFEEPTGSSAFVALKADSPAIRAADPQFCLATDQIGNPRPQVGACDIGAIEAIPTVKVLSDCSVTTTHNLNFRDGPGGNRVGSLEENLTLAAMARTAGWFNVEYEDTSGWISADYVVAEGDCG